MIHMAAGGRLPKSLLDAFGAREAVRALYAPKPPAACVLCVHDQRTATYGSAAGRLLGWCRACGRTWAVIR